MRSPMLRPSVLVAAGLLILASCEHSGPFEADVDGEANLETIQATIFNTSCAVSGCHLGSSAPLGLDLSEGESEANLVDVESRQQPAYKRVDPGNPDDSYIVMKLEGDPRIGNTQRMPAGRPPLPDAQIELVREWIASLTVP